jgi:hypothetical protein
MAVLFTLDAGADQSALPGNIYVEDDMSKKYVGTVNTLGTELGVTAGVLVTESYDGEGGTLTLAMKDASVANEAGVATPASGEWRVNFVDNYRRGKPDYTVNGKIAPEVTSFGDLTLSKAGGSPGLRYITLLIERSGKQSALYGAELADGVRGLSSSDFRTKLQAETGAEALPVPPDFPKPAAR